MTFSIIMAQFPLCKYSSRVCGRGAGLLLKPQFREQAVGQMGAERCEVCEVWSAGVCTVRPRGAPVGASVTVQGGGPDQNLLTALNLTWDSEYGRELSRGAAQKPLKRTWLSTGGGAGGVCTVFTEARPKQREEEPTERAARCRKMLRMYSRALANQRT